MSSFDAAWLPEPQAAPAAGDPFRPLCPAEGTGPPAAGTWRPLFGEVAASVDAGAEVAAVADVEEAAAGRTEAESGVPHDEPAPAQAGSFAAGYELGRQETRAEVEVVAESMVKSLQELADFRARLRQRYERELLGLALGVARKVVGAEVAARPEIWLAMIRDGIRRAVDRERVRVRLPAPVASFLRAHLPALRAQLDDVKELELVEDASLPAGGCVIETRFAELDLGLDAQIEQIERGLGRAG
jgi:flagellar assembly protein FliH